MQEQAALGVEEEHAECPMQLASPYVGVQVACRESVMLRVRMQKEYIGGERIGGVLRMCMRPALATCVSLACCVRPACVLRACCVPVACLLRARCSKDMWKCGCMCMCMCIMASDH